MTSPLCRSMPLPLKFDGCRGGNRAIGVQPGGIHPFARIVIKVELDRDAFLGQRAARTVAVSQRTASRT